MVANTARSFHCYSTPASLGRRASEDNMLEIEIFSDAICPWCFIGKRRLESAITTADAKDGFDPEVRLRWRPYLLYPNIPTEGVDRG